MEHLIVEFVDIEGTKLTTIGTFLKEEEKESKEKKSDLKKAISTQFRIPKSATLPELQSLINKLLRNEEESPYAFFIQDEEVKLDLESILSNQKRSTQETISILYQPQAIHRVKPVTRCTSSLQGHTEAVLCVSFSPDSSLLATASGDKTVKIWDVMTETPIFTLKGHTGWVLYVSWSPDGKKLASGGMDKLVRIWCPKSGKQIGSPLKGHSNYVTAIAWEPFHVNPDCNKVVSVSKDSTAKIWDIILGKIIFSLSGHTMSISCVRWGGEGLIYTASQDRTIKVWDPKEGKLCRDLQKGHAHWINTLALNTDYVLRIGPYDNTGTLIGTTKEEQIKGAIERYNNVIKNGNGEKLLSGSDDFTIVLWEPSKSKQFITQMTGHQKVVNLVSFSPDGRLIASASFDKSIKLWNGSNGKFLATLRGHVEAVYQLHWSSDSRLLVSASKDSTLKIWDMHTKKMKVDLPGHSDEVFWVDWAPDGSRVASGGKDCLAKIWRS